MMNVARLEFFRVYNQYIILAVEKTFRLKERFMFGKILRLLFILDWKGRIFILMRAYT